MSFAHPVCTVVLDLNPTLGTILVRTLLTSLEKRKARFPQIGTRHWVTNWKGKLNEDWSFPPKSFCPVIPKPFPVSSYPGLPDSCWSFLNTRLVSRNNLMVHQLAQRTANSGGRTVRPESEHLRLKFQFKWSYLPCRRARMWRTDMSVKCQVHNGHSFVSICVIVRWI